MTYLAYVLDERTTEVLVGMFPPKFPDVYAHHVTLKFGVKDADAMREFARLPPLAVVGYIADESLEALVVSVAGTTERPDGKIFHITLSLDREQGRKPVQSNELLASKAWDPVVPYHFTAPLALL